jgi:hypothetical protein
MRKELILASLNDGRIVVIDFINFPPSIIASFQDNTFEINDFAYDDNHKMLVYSDKGKGLSCR